MRIFLMHGNKQSISNGENPNYSQNNPENAIIF